MVRTVYTAAHGGFHDSQSIARMHEPDECRTKNIIALKKLFINVAYIFNRVATIIIIK